MLKRKTELPRGILHIAKDEPFVGLDRFEPNEGLSPFVEHYWSVTWEQQPKILNETVPHPAMHLVIEPGASKVHGIQRKRFSRWIEGSGRVLGVKFRPGGFRAFTSGDIKRLTNTIEEPWKLFGQSVLDLESEVVHIPSAAMAFERIDGYLRSLKPQLTPEITIANQIVQTIANDRSLLRAESLAQRFGIGLRSLQRLFSENVGVSPKWVIQRFRIIEAAEKLRGDLTEQDFASLALELGYSDQSHFIRDFKVMVGLTPVKYLQSLDKKS